MNKKKAVRSKFRQDCLERDFFKCKLCPAHPKDNNLEVHHITNRNEMPNGGYVKENGITLCPKHHMQVEKEDGPLVRTLLYHLIMSDHKRAVQASERLDTTH